VNAILAATFRNGVLSPDLVVEPSNADESQAEDLGAGESAKGAKVRYRITNAADIPGNLDQLPGFFGRRWNNLPVFQGRQLHTQCMICERETTPERTWPISAGEHVAEQHDSVVNRLWSEFVFHHATNRSINVLESNMRHRQGSLSRP
jgi:hypothetical protein